MFSEKYFFKISYHTKLSLARHHRCVACKSVHLLHHFTYDCDHEKCFQFSQHCSGAPLTTDTWSQDSVGVSHITHSLLDIMSKPTVVHYSLCLSLPGKILKILTMIHPAMFYILMKCRYKYWVENDMIITLQNVQNIA